MIIPKRIMACEERERKKCSYEPIGGESMTGSAMFLADCKLSEAR